ncbi:hypothetical protein GCM10023187_10280 [Nibrella viscosa]|uniref:TIGR02687 family protein n=1 Tax=Nibrella viscosa TaxID=1084524 RepID=A0ABP8K0U4_9BACT
MSDLRQKIEHHFRQRPHHRVLFFFDPQRSSTDEVTALQSDAFEVLTLGPLRPYFGLKVALESRPAAAPPVLVYCPGLETPRTDADKAAFALLDLLVANDELRLDKVAEFMATYTLQSHQRELVERYRDELLRRDTQSLLQNVLKPDAFDETAVQHGLVARLMGFKQWPDNNTLLARLLTDRRHADDQEKYLTRLRQLGLDEYLRRRLADVFFDGPLTEPITGGLVQQLVLRLKYNLMVQPLPTENEPYPTLRVHRSDALSRMHILQDKMGTEALETLLTELGDAVREDNLVTRYGTDASYGYYTPQLRERVLQQVLTDYSYQPDKSLQTLDKLLATVSAGHTQRLLLQTVQFGIQLLTGIGNIPSYRLDTPEDYIRQYERTFSRIDTLYRWFVQTRRDWYAQASSDAEGADNVAEWLEPFEKQGHDRYDRFLLELNREWLACLRERRYDLRSLNVPKQYEFYRRHIRDANQKVAVIIADGLRYEIARELLDELNQDTKTQASLGLMLTGIPSTTRLGMANLLPHNGLQFDGQYVSISGQRTEGLDAREAILKAANPRSRAVDFRQLEGMRREDIRELFREEVVYVYHNLIDYTGDKRDSEGDTFKAVRESLNDLKRLIKQLHSQYNVAKVLLTADHGFVYQHLSPDEPALEKSPDVAARQEHNRYVIADDSKPLTVGHTFPMASTTALAGVTAQVYTPEGVNRYRRQGSGMRYVHGGGSLQEVLVPLLETSRKRGEGIGQKVSVRLVRDDLAILANQVKVLLLQEQRVSANERAKTVAVGLYVGNELASNRVELLFDSVAENPSGRIRECTLHLTGNLPPQRQYTLRITDVADELNPLLERPVQNKTIIERDF